MTTTGRDAQPGKPRFARVVELRGVPQTLDRVLEYVESDIVPAFSGVPGFVSLDVLVNREEATILAVGIYADEATAAAARGAVSEHERAARRRVGGGPHRDDLRGR